MFSTESITKSRLSVWIRTAAVIAVAASFGVVTKVSASPAAQVIVPGVGLDTLINGGSIQVGDKIFSDFSIAGFDAAGITVIGIQENGSFGLRLQGGFAAFGNQIKDIVINFSAAVAPESSELISGVKLDFNGAVLVGQGSASVTETAVDAGNNQLLVPALFVVNPPPVLSASADLTSPQQKIFVSKEIVLTAGGETPANKRLAVDALNAVTISQIDQLFPQIPEPGTVVLVAAGLLGVAMTGRRRK